MAEVRGEGASLTPDEIEKAHLRMEATRAFREFSQVDPKTHVIEWVTEKGKEGVHVRKVGSLGKQQRIKLANVDAHLKKIGFDFQTTASRDVHAQYITKKFQETHTLGEKIHL